MATSAIAAVLHDDLPTVITPTARLEVDVASGPRAPPVGRARVGSGASPSALAFLCDIPILGRIFWWISMSCRGIRSVVWPSSRKSSESFGDDHQFVIDLKHMGTTGFRFDKDALFGRLRKVPGLLLWGAVLMTLVMPRYMPTTLACITLLCLLQNVTVMLFATLNTMRGFSSMRAAMRRPPPHPSHVVLDPASARGSLRDSKGVPQPQAADVLHLIAICRCTEPVEVLEETLGNLASHDNKEAYIVVLALESKDPNAAAVGETLIRKFGRQFFRVMYAVHPSGVEGEVPGKSANTGWAVRTSSAVLEKEMGPAALDRMVVTVCDIDAIVSQNYFNALSDKFAASVRENREVFFAPPMLFNEDAADAAAAALGGAVAPTPDTIMRSNSGRIVMRAMTGGAIPAPVKIADQMWSMFLLQNLASGNWVKMPCSTYSVGLRLIASVGYWDVGVESIPEDYHTALKLYWGTGGRCRCEPIYHPVLYQHIDGGSWLGGVNQRFQQGCRHMWGATDVAYVFWLAARIHSVPLYEKIMIVFTVCDVHLSAAVITFMGSFAFPILLFLRPDWLETEDGQIAVLLQKCLTAVLLSLTGITAATYEWHVTDMVAMCTGGGGVPALSTPRKRAAAFGPSLSAAYDDATSLFNFFARLTAWLWAPLVAVLYLLAPASFAQTKLIFTDRLKLHVSPKSAPVASTPTAAAMSSSSASLGTPMSHGGSSSSFLASDPALGSVSSSSSSGLDLGDSPGSSSTAESVHVGGPAAHHTSPATLGPVPGPAPHAHAGASAAGFLVRVSRGSSATSADLTQGAAGIV